MSQVFTVVKMGNPEKPGYTEIDAIVDTRATLTVVPRELADKIGLEVTGEAVVQTDAGVLKLPRSRAWVEVEGKSEVIPILILDVIDRVLLGVTALEILGLTLDTIAGKLKEWIPLLY